MKRLVALVIAGFFAVSVAAPAEAQVPLWEGPQYRAHGHTALVVPFEPIAFAEVWQLGYSMGGGASMFVTENLELGLQVGYTRFGTSSGPHAANQLDLRRWTNGQISLPGGADISGVDVTVGGGAFSALSLQTDIAYHIVTDVPVTPYFVIGPGVHRSQIDDARYDVEGELVFGDQSHQIDFSGEVAGRKETAFGLRLGVGADINIGQDLLVKVEPSYTVLFGTEENVHFVPIRVGTVYAF